MVPIVTDACGELWFSFVAAFASWMLSVRASHPNSQRIVDNDDCVHKNDNLVPTSKTTPIADFPHHCDPSDANDVRERQRTIAAKCTVAAPKCAIPSITK